eukprot:gb/GECH01000599.1/.p1 GENE.gb/GECH01000599.1/~~gb/GECH01000599.1/.p1  ORF type:complete len:705 (+),score=256.55 gb/GECH01000599.1/:1-2115(+)
MEENQQFPESSQKLNSVTLDKFFSPNQQLADDLRTCLSEFYGWGKTVRKNTPKGLRRYGENLDELPVEGLESEQIWQLLSLDASKSVDAVSQDITKLEKSVNQMEEDESHHTNIDNDDDSNRDNTNQELSSDDEDSEPSMDNTSDTHMNDSRDEGKEGITEEDVNLYDSDDASDADVKDILKRTMEQPSDEEEESEETSTHRGKSKNTKKTGFQFEKDGADGEFDKEDMFFGDNDSEQESEKGEGDDDNDPEYNRILQRAMKMDEESDNEEDDEEDDDQNENDTKMDYSGVQNKNEDQDQEMNDPNEQDEEKQLASFLEDMENQIDEWDEADEEAGEEGEDELVSDDDDGGWFNEDGTLREGDGTLSKKEEKSFFKKQQDKILDQAEEIEEENLQEKPWMLSGETFSFQRPKESLLEVHMDFDQGSKMAPKTTQETTKTLEDIIIGRVVEGIFDDPEKRGENKDEQDKQPRKELDQEQSDKGLADVYEEMYLKKAYNQEDDSEKQELDKKLKGIDKKFNHLMQKLDALTNFHYVPKIPESEVEVKTSAPNNAVPALSMEDPTPTAISNADQQRPEEMIQKKNYLEKAANEEDATDKKRKYRKMKSVAKKKGVRGKEKERQVQMQNIISSMEYGKAKGKVTKAQKSKLKKDLLSGHTDVTDYTNSKQVFNLLQRQSEKNKKNKDSNASSKQKKSNQDVSQYKVKL